MTEKRFEQLTASHVAYIENELKHQSYNLGWAQTDEAICSKLYGHKTIYCITSYFNGDTIEHQQDLHQEPFAF